MMGKPSVLFGNIEYVTLRVIRRFLFPQALHRLGRYLPYYRTNLSEVRPGDTCDLYVRWLETAGRPVAGRRIVEVGSGATNAAGYALVCAGAARVWCVEPYVEFDRPADNRLLGDLARQHGGGEARIGAAVERLESLKSIPRGSADIIVSHSVLEHVRDLRSLFEDMAAAVAPDGAMVHVVDYRDHFFKYPFHFLQFSARTWQRYLDPGELPRWRMSDHQSALRNAGFEVRVLHREEDRDEFARILPHVSVDFDRTDPSLGVLQAVLFCTPSKPESTMQ